MQFDYTSFVYETFEKKSSQFSSLQQLVVRKVPLANLPPEENPTHSNLTGWDRYTHLYHGLFQLPSLTELDLSDNKIHKELQAELQVRKIFN